VKIKIIIDRNDNLKRTSRAKADQFIRHWFVIDGFDGADLVAEIGSSFFNQQSNGRNQFGQVV